MQEARPSPSLLTSGLSCYMGSLASAFILMTAMKARTRGHHLGAAPPGGRPLGWALVVWVWIRIGIVCLGVLPSVRG